MGERRRTGLLAKKLGMTRLFGVDGSHIGVTVLQVEECEVVAVKTLPHPDGGFMVTVETHRHDNIPVTGHLKDVEYAGRTRDALGHLLVRADEGTVIRYAAAGDFTVENVV